MKRSYHDTLLAGSVTAEPPTTLAALRRLRPLIRRHATRDQKIAYNAAIRAAKGQRFDTCDSRFGYGPMAKPKVEAQNFADMARQYHRRNAVEVELKTPTGLLGES
jgi:hypothetical protein